MQSVLFGLRPAVVAMIASAGLGILRLSLFRNGQIAFSIINIQWTSVAIFGAGLLVLRKWKASPLVVMGGAGVVGLILNTVTGG